MLQVLQIPVWRDNYAYLLRCTYTDTVACVDSPEAAPILQELQTRGWTLDLLLNTHHHPDHVGANSELKRETGCRVVGSCHDPERIPGIDRQVDQGDQVQVGEQHAQVLFIPGHTRGHIAYYFAQANALFSGDTLFVAGCGRLFEGTAEQLWNSFQKLMALPPQTQIYGAHEYTLSNIRFAKTVEPDNLALQVLETQAQALRDSKQPTVPSTLAQELQTNPFLRVDQPEIARALGLSGAPPAQVLGELRARKDVF